MFPSFSFCVSALPGSFVVAARTRRRYKLSARVPSAHASPPEKRVAVCGRVQRVKRAQLLPEGPMAARPDATLCPRRHANTNRRAATVACQRGPR